MSEEPLGPQVLAAVKFLQQIYQDLEILVRHADKVFAEKGWAPADKDRNNVFARLGSRLKAAAWLLTRLYRCYAPRTGRSADRAIALVPVLDPPGGYSEPICMACLVDLSRPVSPESLTKKRKWLRSLLNQVAGQGDRFELPDKVVRSLLPQAARMRGVVVRLCDLTGERELEGRLLRPILEMIEQS